jgi:hypothetical protein
MIGYSDEAKVMDLLAPLRRLEPVPFEVSRRAEWRPLWRRPILVAAIVMIALVLAGIAIADGLGAFDGISAAQHPQTGADVLDPQTVARLEQTCSSSGNPSSIYFPQCHLILDSARFVAQLPSGRKLYVITDTRGDLCMVDPTGMVCGTGLTPSRPIEDESVGELMFGLALDGVTSISFERAGKEVMVPVRDNVWVYEGASLPEAGALTAHFEDGTTVTISP